jgi:hypothetical protein
MIAFLPNEDSDNGVSIIVARDQDLSRDAWIDSIDTAIQSAATCGHSVIVDISGSGTHGVQTLAVTLLKALTKIEKQGRSLSVVGLNEEICEGLRLINGVRQLIAQGRIAIYGTCLEALQKAAK